VFCRFYFRRNMMLATRQFTVVITWQVVRYGRIYTHIVAYNVARYLAPRDFHVAGQRVPTDRKGVSVLWRICTAKGGASLIYVGADKVPSPSFVYCSKWVWSYNHFSHAVSFMRSFPVEGGTALRLPVCASGFETCGGHKSQTWCADSHYHCFVWFKRIVFTVFRVTLVFTLS